MQFTPLFIFVVIFQFFGNCSGEVEGREGVFDKIKSGLQYAKDYLETAKEIADLVSKSLGHFKNGTQSNNSNSKMKENNNSEKRGDESRKNGRKTERSQNSSLISGFFRLLGLDSPRIAAIAVNSVIFLAQMISSLFDVKPRLEESRSREARERFDPLEFIVNNENERVKKLVAQAHDPNLPEHLMRRLDDFDASCVKLFICKTSPIILAAQNSLRNGTVGRRFDVTSWLPKFEDFEENSDVCDDKHPDCPLFPEIT